MRRACWLAVLLILVVRAEAVYYGQPRAEVLKELGKPVSQVTRGDREILMYPQGVRLELEQRVRALEAENQKLERHSAFLEDRIRGLLSRVRYVIES